MFISLTTIICFLAGVYGFMSGVKHLLSMLISLEFMILMVYVAIAVQSTSNSQFITLMFLIFSVCEGVLGLTILVAMARSFGGDYLNSFSLSG